MSFSDSGSPAGDSLRRPVLLLAVLPAIPCGAALGYWIYPDLDPALRYVLYSIGWALCFGPFFGWWWFSVSKPMGAIAFFMGGILARLIGLLGVVVWVWSKPENRASVVLFAVVIGSFLFFEVVSMTLFQIITRKKA